MRGIDSEKSWPCGAEAAHRPAADARIEVAGKQIVCTDATGAGAGELVYWCKGKEASFPFLPTEVPTDSTVVGIIDKITLRRGQERMLIGRVIGEVVATAKHASHDGRKALLVQPLTLDGADRGTAVVALDAVDAGIGDRVLLIMEGFSAMTSVGRPDSPIDMAVVGVIDRLDLMPAAAPARRAEGE